LALTGENVSGFQGNLSNQIQVAIYDPIHDYVQAALENRYQNKKFFSLSHGLRSSLDLPSIQAASSAQYMLARGI